MEVRQKTGQDCFQARRLKPGKKKDSLLQQHLKSLGIRFLGSILIFNAISFFSNKFLKKFPGSSESIFINIRKVGWFLR